MDLSGWYGPDCKKWLGPNTAGSSVPDHLTGEYPGGCGWDSAGPAADPNAIKRLRTAEVLHDRWAMLGTLWCEHPIQHRWRQVGPHTPSLPK